MNRIPDDIYGEVPSSFDSRLRNTLANLPDTPVVPISAAQKPRRFRRRSLASLIAAVLVVAILGGTALATGFFGLNSMVVTDPLPAATADPSAPPAQIIALQGFPESSEYKANAEWMEYLAKYDINAVLAGGEAFADPEGEYLLYSVYSPDMAEKLKEIAGKYGLSLQKTPVSFADNTEFSARTGLPVFLDGCVSMDGYVCDSGSFLLNGTSLLGGKCFEYQLGSYRKGSFSEVTLNIGRTGDYKEWPYVTKDGTEVQLALGPSRCVLLADLPDTFIALNLLGGTTGESLFMPYPIDAGDMQALADSIDFSALR